MKSKIQKIHGGSETAARNGMILGLVGALITAFIAFFLLLVPINIHDGSFWLTVIMILVIFATLRLLVISAEASANLKNGVSVREISDVSRKAVRFYAIPAVLFALFLILEFFSSAMFHASAYSSVLDVQDVEFAADLNESVGTSSIALMDTSSAKMLGDREIGTLSNVVSQYDVSDDYTQIDLNGTPKKVAALDYAGFFKWLGNRDSGVPGYVIVDPVSMSASYEECTEGMVYVPSAYILEDAARHIWLHYPTEIFYNLHFEVDESGDPYYIAPVYTRTIGLFGGETVKGCIVMNPVNGDTEYYDLEDVPTWVDMVYDGDLLCEQYNWYGIYQNGFINSLFAKKGCKQVTTFVDTDAEGEESYRSDYGYVAKDGDIWIYTGVTSVNGDSSNIGFLLADERTGESHYYSIAGADEKSAMAAAEGEVQEKGYQASFPSLINVDGNPTYIMVLKDQSGLVKLYATVNVEQYNLVTTASTQEECMTKYRRLLGLEQGDVIDDSDEDESTDAEEPLTADSEATVIIRDIRDIVVDGNTWIYLITEDDAIYRGEAASNEALLLLSPGDTVHIESAGEVIVDFAVVEE